MWLRVVRTTCFAALTAVAVPYAVALMTNILCGWPLCTNRYRRAFNPYKVFALNWALLLQLNKLRYVGLIIRWRRFYQNASRNRLIKNIAYGSNGNCLDMYFPMEETAQRESVSKFHRPVVVFIYGGSWGSGDKSMYGLLASQLADSLSAVVVCPNYSTYPKGFVDDMAQDVSDVLAFIHQTCDIYCMDKGRIALIGHSAGAHLAALTVLELSLKHLLDGPASEAAQQHERRVDSLQVSVIEASTTSTSGDVLRIHERHFNGDTGGGDESKQDVGAVSVSEVENSSFYLLQTDDSIRTSSAAAGDGTQLIDSQTPNVTEAKADGNNESFYFVDDKSVSVNADSMEPMLPAAAASQLPTDAETEEDPHRQDDESDNNIETDVKAPVIGTPPPVPASSSLNDPDSLLTSVRLVIGLAGVYNIAAHYEHQSKRGVEDVNTMARAMYGPKRFDRFSPTLIVDHLPQNAWLPPIHLIHGSDDHIVPVSSSTCFGDAVWRHGTSVVTATVVAGCGHYDVCMDVMEKSRFWHGSVMTEIRRVFLQHV